MADVVIIGMPASGKSTVGRDVARQLGVAFSDSDALIEEKTGRLIREIFADDGEAAFRAIEAETVSEALARPGVLALGGGAILSEATRAALADAPVVWLEVSVANATRRAGLSQVRPLLLGDVRARLETLMAQRRHLYEQVASFRVDTNRKTTHAIAGEVVERLRGTEQTTIQAESGRHHQEDDQ